MLSAARKLTGPIAALLATLLLIVAFDFTGRSSRTFEPGLSTYDVATPAEATGVWRSLGLHGRTLVNIDHHLAIDPENASLNAVIEALDAEAEILPADETNIIGVALSSGVARRVVHIVTDASWPVASERLEAVPEVTREGQGYRLVKDGAPIVVTRLRDLPDLGERAIVYVNSDVVPDHDPQLLEALVGDPATADVVIRVESAQ